MASRKGPPPPSPPDRLRPNAEPASRRSTSSARIRSSTFLLVHAPGAPVQYRAGRRVRSRRCAAPRSSSRSIEVAASDEAGRRIDDPHRADHAACPRLRRCPAAMAGRSLSERRTCAASARRARRIRTRIAQPLAERRLARPPVDGFHGRLAVRSAQPASFTSRNARPLLPGCQPSTAARSTAGVTVRLQQSTNLAKADAPWQDFPREFAHRGSSIRGLAASRYDSRGVGLIRRTHLWTR